VDTECASLLVGHVDFLDDLVIGYFRFRSATLIEGLTEVALVTRFLFVAVGPSDVSTIVDLTELGRACATLLNDRVCLCLSVFLSVRLYVCVIRDWLYGYHRKV